MQPQDNPNSGTSNQSASPSANVTPASPAPSAASAARFSNNKKKWLVGGIVAAVLVLGGGGAGAYFGIIAPNKPENVWKKSLENTAKGYDKLIEYADKKKDVKGGTLSGNFKVESGKTTADGTIEAKSDGTNSNTKLTLGVSGARVELDLLTTLPNGSKNPDIYAKISGLKGIDQALGSDYAGLGSTLASFDNQWYVIDHTLLDELEKSSASQTPNISSAEVTALVKDLGGVTKEYVLTDNPSKAVLVVKQNIGKETMDGRSVYHYKVGVNKANLKSFQKALCNKFIDSKAGKAIAAVDTAQFSKEDCNDTSGIDDIKDSDTFDVWVDLKTKVIHTVRFTDSTNKNNYVDLGLLYTGGDEYPFVIRGQGKEDGSSTKGELKVTLNTKTDKTTFVGKLDGTSDSQDYKVTLDANFQPSNDKVEFKKPDGVKSLMEAIGALSGSTSLPSSSPSPTNSTLESCLSAPELSPSCEALFNEQ